MLSKARWPAFSVGLPVSSSLVHGHLYLTSLVLPSERQHPCSVNEQGWTDGMLTPFQVLWRVRRKVQWIMTVVTEVTGPVRWGVAIGGIDQGGSGRESDMELKGC